MQNVVTKKLDAIQDFIAAWKKYDSDETSPLWAPNWNRRFREAGYYLVDFSRSPDKDSADLYTWCIRNFQDRFAWTGNRYVFWFETEKDAVLFSLKWL